MIRLRRKTEVLDQHARIYLAEQLLKDEDINTPHGIVQGFKGDWKVRFQEDDEKVFRRYPNEIKEGIFDELKK